ncbi:MAG: HAMP domain-containing histidine kinase [Anaerolineales bacterium]|nr:HAMP domain-containing histidine kinase [Anaerolineales bacterium]
MSKRILILISLLAPALILGLAALFPLLDPRFEYPLLHFYVVTFSTFAAAVAALFTHVSLGSDTTPRHRLLAFAFGAMGLVFLIHGVLTPGALVFTFNPGIRWAAWLTLFVGGLIFALAAADMPNRPIALRVPVVYGAFALFYVPFVLIVALAPEWLAFIDSQAAPWHQQMIFGVTLLIWLYAAVRLRQTWRQTQDGVDRVMMLIAAWMTLGSVSMHQFANWQLSWWLYHVLLLMGVGTAVFVLARRYERVRRFRLTDYYAAGSLIVTAALALLASSLFSRAVEQDLRAQYSAQAVRVGQNLAISLAGDMPAAAGEADLRDMAQQANLFRSATWAARLAGLEIGRVSVYDDGMALVYPPDERPFPEDGPFLVQALAGEPTTRFVISAAPLFAGATADRYLQTYIPIPSASGPAAPLGVLSTLQELPDLVPAVIRARLTGLLIAGFSMGLLFLSLLVIVRRADRLITTRTNELARANAELQAAKALRDDLTDMIVHDLRTPLTTVNLSLDLLERTLDDPSKQQFRGRFFQGAREQLTRMLGLINQLLDVARLETGQLRVETAAFPVARLLEEKASLFALQAEADDKCVQVDAAAPLPPAMGDRELVGRVLDNLIANALKYTQPGGQITLRARDNGAMLQVQVADDGEGIAPEAAARIFDKFYQVTDGQGRPVRRGTGLGLTFCKLVVEAHDGRIWVDSTPGKGSTFSFTLPAR